MIRLSLLFLLACCKGSDPTPPTPDPTPQTPARVPPAPRTVSNPNAFFTKGAPTIIIGTAGSDTEDRDIAGQARFLRGLFFPDAPLITDSSVTGAWPDTPVLYGGPHVNTALARIVPLPFEMTADRLVIGGQTFEGEGIALITVLQAGVDHPELMLYAGTGPLGVAEINARMGGGKHTIVVADRFGTLATGTWVDGRAELGPRAPRIDWRTEELHAQDLGVFYFGFPAQLPAREDERAIITAGSVALDRIAKAFGLAKLPSMTFYVYPDQRSKQSLTGNAGHGQAVPAARALHMIAAPGASLGHLIAHEATHVVLRESWGAPGSVLLGEGIAVWASGHYQGRTLDDWKRDVKRRPIADLLGKAFLQLPEPETYPLAGLFVDAAVAAVGLDKLREHLYPATSAEWPDACKRAGTTPEALEQALTARLAP